MAREQWTSRLGFILASTGAAVGIGNIWRFSYVAGQNGGGAFLVVYVLCVLIIGIPLLIAELALGRRGRGDAVAAFAALAPRSLWVVAGGFGVLVASLILAYYAVIAGWVLKYLAGALIGTLCKAPKRVTALISPVSSLIRSSRSSGSWSRWQRVRSSWPPESGAGSSGRTIS